MGAVALLASCNKQLDTQNDESAAKGIVFSVQEQDQTKAQYNPLEENVYDRFFWYAETDNITIYYKNAGVIGAAPFYSSVYDENNSVAYKATRSAYDGVFTAKDGANILTFVPKTSAPADASKAEPASFLAYYGNHPTPAANATVTKFNIPAPATNAYTQSKKDGSDIAPYIMMLAEQKNVAPASNWDSWNNPTQNIKLYFDRPHTALMFQTKNYDASIYGALNSIKIELKGQKNEDGNIIAGPGKIYFGTGATYEISTKKTTLGAGNSSILTWNNGGFPWADDAIAYLPIDTVKRNYTETYEITYTFANVTLKKSATTSSNWPTNPSNFVKAKVLDMQEEPYIVTNDQKSLIVNSGTLAGIIDQTGNNIVWAAGNAPISGVEKIVVNAELSNSDLALLKKFTGLKNVTLAKNKNIPNKTFVPASGTIQLNYIKFNEVETIASGAFNAQTGLTEVYLPKWNGSVESNDTFKNLFKNTVVSKIDVSGISVIGDTFENSLPSFSGFTALTSVTLKDGVLLRANAFKGNSSLVTVNGKVDLIGESAFEGTAIKKITVLGNITANAFKDCTSLEVVIAQPTVIEPYAFSGANNLKTLNVSKLQTIGAGAFKNCSGFGKGLTITGTSDKGVDGLVFPELLAIPAYAFENCAASSYDFAKVSSVSGDKALSIQAPTGKKIRFQSSFSLNGDVFNGASALGTVTIWVPASMKNLTSGTYFVGSTINWGSGSSAKSQAFASVSYE